MSKNVTLEEKINIKNKFDEIYDIADFCTLLNHCCVILFSEDLLKINEKSLKILADQNNKSRYYKFDVPKKNGGVRVIHSPNSELKMVLKCINLIFNCIYTPHTAATGFVTGKSVVDNSIIHCGSNYVFNLDLKDFFPSIEIGRILNRFNFPPFNLNKNNNRDIIGNYIGWLACESMIVERTLDNKMTKVVKRVLPQGSPLSPTLTNIICERLDRRLTGLANRHGVKFSRYADDITFSSMHNVYQSNSDFRNSVVDIIKSQYFTINESKVRLQKNIVRQEVTGLVVNKTVNVSKTYVKRLRLWLNMWEKYGTQEALVLFLNGYIKDKGHAKKIGENSFFMENVIEGKLNYLKMVKGENNSTYLSLKKRFEKLSLKNNSIDEILEIWEKKGINEAMSKFYKV